MKPLLNASFSFTTNPYVVCVETTDNIGLNINTFLLRKIIIRKIKTKRFFFYSFVLSFNLSTLENPVWRT